MASGDTKTEHLLDVLANGSRADIPEGGCCNSKTQNYILGAINRIIDVEEEVERLENNPDVADIVATYADLQSYDTSKLTDNAVIRVLADETHNDDSTYYRYSLSTGEFTYIGESKQYTDFVGTDGTAAGEAGLVPAPAVADAGKFLKADGTWDAIATSSGAKVLTSADNNWNSTAHNSTTEPFDAIALWLLPNGVYIDDYKNGDSSLKIYRSDGNSAQSGNDSSIYLVTDSGTSSSPNRIVTQVNKDDIKQYRPARQFSNFQMLTTFAKKSDIYYTNNSNTSDWARPQIGAQSNASGARAIAIGTSASATAKGSVAIGAYSSSSTVGVMDIGTSDMGHGYSTSNYRLLSGLYDGQSAHDAATVGQINATIDAINTALNTSIPHIGANS